MTIANPGFLNTVRITATGFKCERCGAEAAATVGAIMIAYLREVNAFERAHRACAIVDCR